MGIISQKGADAKAIKKAETLLSEGILQQNQLLLQGIDAISPQLAEHLGNNPDTLLAILPRVQGIAQKLGLNLSTDPLSPSPAPSSPHPFGSDER